ncbi:putative phosphoenolpyruvate synthase, partial [Trichonephila inaurata madagascariensis]
ERSDSKKDCEESVFAKFVFLWKAASDVYDCTLDTNLKGFANAMARSEWKSALAPPVKEFIEIVNCYAQTGVLDGTVSINDGPEYEMYLFGEKVRNLAFSCPQMCLPLDFYTVTLTEDSLKLPIQRNERTTAC